MKGILGLILWCLPISAHAIMNGRGQDIFPETAVFYASATVLDARGVGAAQVRLADNVVVSSETSAALGAGVRVSSNVYIVGFSSAAKYYGDGSGLGNISDATKVLKAGDTMTGALTLPADPSSALQAAPKQYVDSWTRPCVNPGDAGDTMAPVGGWCVDKYEASVWSTSTGGTQYGVNGADNYPCNDNAQDCAAEGTKIYARSVAGYKPAASLTWFQANLACGNSGKELLPNAVWQMAAAGTPDPGALAQDTGPQCNTSGTQSMQTGQGTSCRSSFDVENMIGSVWEWVADLGTAGAGASAAYGTMVQMDGTGTGYNDDGHWNIGGNSYTSYAAPAAWIQGQIPAVLRGGSWGNGANSGVFTFDASGAPSHWSIGFGFRCGRRR